MTTDTTAPPIELEDRPPNIRWGVVLSWFAVAFILRFAYFYLDDLARQVPGTLVRRLIEEGTGNIGSALFFPIAVLFERRFPVDRGRWRRTWIAHVAGYVAYSAAHTTFLAASRALLFPAVGMGTYDYGVLSTRYFMESAQDFFSYATFIAILTLVRVERRLRDREIRSAELARDAANARLEALSLRLQPHFLFNALNTISSTVYENPVAADEMIGRLGDLLRQSLRTATRHEIPVGEEMDTLDAYLSFVDARFGDRVRCRVETDPPARDLAIPAFMLQPLVENAVHHGASAEYGSTDIRVRVTKTDDHLDILVENDVARPSSADGERTGLGTTRDRLRLLYGGRATLETSTDDRRFRVAIRIPARHLDTPPSDAAEPIYARTHR
jgi:two-component sensor histidine kinase